MISKILKMSALLIAGILFVIAFILTAGSIYSKYLIKTPAFKDSDSKIIKNSIAVIERIKLGGYRQSVLIRSKNINNPILLFLHGGPGSSETASLRKYNSVLEDHFTMVYWDQRGTGKSFSFFMDKKTLKIEQFITDTIELINILRSRFNKEKIFLAGHSWGSALGVSAVKRHPELFYAYIGIGQIASMLESEKISYQYTLRMAKETGNESAVNELNKIKTFPVTDKKYISDVGIQRKWLVYFGGALYGEKDYGKLMRSFTVPECSVFDLFNFFMGAMYSLINMWPELIEKGNIMDAYPALDVPVYFLTGRHDYNVAFELTEKYFNILKAPEKELVWFEKSAHMPCFEEPDKFNEFMINKVRSQFKP